MTFLQAIAREEGYYSAGTRPARNKNPGDLEYHDWQKPFGAVLESGPHARFAVFPTEEAGFAAMKHLFGFPIYKGKTVAQAINTWAPSSENQTSGYIAAVVKWVGCTPDTIIDSLLS